MEYDISIRIEQDYERLATGGRFLLYLLPAHLPGEQHLLAGHVDIQPAPDERIERADFFGNRVQEAVFRGTYDSLGFTMRARVARLERQPRLDISPRLPRLGDEIAAVASLAADAPHHFLGATPRVGPFDAATDYARAIVSPRMSVLEAFTAIGMAIHGDMRFDAEATDVDTPPAEAFAHRHGVCQDFSHVMIAALRGIGIPAGYVSGYLRTLPPPGRERLEGADAMHAWVRAWCGSEMGWVEFDPTNGVLVSSDHIVAAHGRDYSDVSPVQGVMRMAGDQTSRHAVDVVPAEAVRRPGPGSA